MKKPITLVIATRNTGKTAEIRDLLKGFPVDIKNLDDFGPLPPLKEDGNTFDENAYQKASFAAKILGLPALADDSGLLVEALDGAPGRVPWLLGRGVPAAGGPGPESRRGVRPSGSGEPGQ